MEKLEFEKPITERSRKKGGKAEYLHFRVDTMALLHEIVNNAMPQSMGVLKIPLNVFRNLLGQVAQRATELNDPELNILMLELTLYEVPNNEISKMIKQQKKLIKTSTEKINGKSEKEIRP